MNHLVSNKNFYTIVVLTAITLLLLGAMSTINTSLFALKYISTMSGTNEVPPVNTTASGYTSFRTAANDTALKYKVNVTGISNATGANIHIGKSGINGDVVVDLLKDSKKNPTKLGMAVRGNITDSDLTGTMQGKTLTDLISAMNGGNTYVNIQTPSYPDGEIRGQIELGSGIANSNKTTTVNATDTGNLTGTS